MAAAVAIALRLAVSLFIAQAFRYELCMLCIKENAFLPTAGDDLPDKPGQIAEAPCRRIGRQGSGGRCLNPVWQVFAQAPYARIRVDSDRRLVQLVIAAIPFDRIPTVRGLELEVRLGSSAVGHPHLVVGGPIGRSAYAGLSSTMRPSLHPYFSSKSAFTAAAS
jgi:hypothetical protein